MGLKEALLELADEMQAQGAVWHDADVTPDHAGQVLWDYAKQIRVAVKAAGDHPHTLVPMHPDAHVPSHRELIEREKAGMRAERGREQQALKPGDTDRLLECVGGDSDGVLFPGPGELEEGAKTVIGGDVYAYHGGRLHFHCKMKKGGD